jgi:Putative DNA-binding domain
MAGRAEEIFEQLQDATAIVGLIGEPEDAHLDCKEWPSKDDDAQKMVAKAACGMTNADGGILIIGMKAESRPKDEPDVITATAPVNDTTYVKSNVLGLISKLVEPGIVGIEAREIADSTVSKSGFVVVYIPKSEGSPRRSRKDSKFYQRIGSATLPMEYWQIEDMFGKRPHPRLKVTVAGGGFRKEPFNFQIMRRVLIVTVTNEGRGIARYPALRVLRVRGVSPPSLNDSEQSLWPSSTADPDWYSFRGGSNDVLYPGESLRIVGLGQVGNKIEAEQGSPSYWPSDWEYPSVKLETEVVCEGLSSHRQSFSLGSTSFLGAT